MTMLFGDLVSSSGAILFDDLDQQPTEPSEGAVLNDLGDPAELYAQAGTLSGNGTLTTPTPPKEVYDLGDAVELVADSASLSAAGILRKPQSILGAGSMIAQSGQVAGSGTHAPGSTFKAITGVGVLVAGRASIWTPQPTGGGTGGDPTTRAVLRSVIRSIIRPVLRPLV